MKRGLGQLERLLFAYVQMRGTPTVRAGDLVGPLQLTPPRERSLLSRLAKAGMIVRVWRGLYLVPGKLPLGGRWSPGEALAVTTLMTELDGRYQISGPNAFNRYGLDEQMPNRVYVYNNRISGERTIGTVALTLIKVADERLGDTVEFAAADGASVVYASRSRTLVDAVYDWSRFNSLPRAFGWIRDELAAERIGAGALVRSTLRYGDVGTIRRMGALLDQTGVAPALLRKLERAIKPSSSFIPWNPARPKRGTLDRRWGIVWNDEV